MATVLDRPSDGTGSVPTPPSSNGSVALLKRPQAMWGFWSWITTVDHKRIGILYGVTAMIFFLLGGIEALLIRLQLSQPNGDVLSADAYNQVFTMHGTTMVFLVVMPLSAAFFNYLAPIMIGARDVAFPRLNALSYWIFLMGGLFIYSSFLLGGAPDGGWFGYAPNTSITFSPGHNIDYWIFGLQILGIASTVGAVNLITTILNLRAPGMTLMRMPVFVWMTLVANFLLLFAMPVITVALFLLMFDRQFGGNFFNPAAGGDPVLWQHLFWLFGHPEVYILILPAMGIVSEILPTFSRKPLFGYPVIVFSGIAIGFMGWGVWAHHMFAVGLGPVAVSAFSVATMFIAVPTGVKIFNWVGTMWGGSLRLHTPMLFAIGFIAMFTIGGLSGVTHSISPHDRQQTDTYYIVAHFHYVIFGGSMFGLMGGLYYWWPKIFGHMLSEKIGKIHFWSWLIGFNLAFAPMHWLGLQGMPRRIYTYDDDLGLTAPNVASTIGAFIIAASTLVFLYNVLHSYRTREAAVNDPWDARTLEWTIPSPTPVYNFAETPTVHALDDFWHRKYTEDDQGRLQRIPVSDEERAEAEAREAAAVANAGNIHLPSPSFYPIIVAFGLPVIAYGMVYKAYIVAVVGALIMLAGIYAWGLEPSAEPAEHHDLDPGEGSAGELEGEHLREDASLVAAGGDAATPALESGAAAEKTEG
ncbi:MAG: cytochrome c oxidase subunit I [Actinomycetota bacterium]|nr:cytochrome c oxidase subunit I [Actinomycetota bacterium]